LINKIISLTRMLNILKTFMIKITKITRIIRINSYNNKWVKEKLIMLSSRSHTALMAKEIKILFRNKISMMFRAVTTRIPITWTKIATRISVINMEAMVLINMEGPYLKTPNKEYKMITNSQTLISTNNKFKAIYRQINSNINNYNSKITNGINHSNTNNHKKRDNNMKTINKKISIVLISRVNISRTIINLNNLIFKNNLIITKIK